jgi:hypothetical protein
VLSSLSSHHARWKEAPGNLFFIGALIPFIAVLPANTYHQGNKDFNIRLRAQAFRSWHMILESNIIKIFDMSGQIGDSGNMMV